MFYSITVTEIRIRILSDFPSVTPRENTDPGFEIANLLWMCEQIESMNQKSIREALKASRWIGWMIRECESLGFWDAEYTRKLVQSDCEEKNDLPHLHKPPTLIE